MTPTALGVVASGRKASGGWTPLTIPGCRLWLDAAQLGLADNANVTTWPDLSGNGNTFTSLIAAKYVTTPPGWTTPAVRFDTASLRSVTAFMTGCTSAEICFMARPTAADTYWMYGWGSPTDACHWPYSGVVYDSFGSTVRKATGLPYAANVWHPTSVYTAPGDWGVHFPGGLAYSTTSNVVGWNSTSGGFHEVGNAYNPSNMYLADLFVYDHKLSGSERAAAFAYMGRNLS